MAVHLRLTRTGRHKRPLYRVVAADSRKPRDGRFLEILGIFDPLKEPAVPELKQERVLSWLRQGASQRSRSGRYFAGVAYGNSLRRRKQRRRRASST